MEKSVDFSHISPTVYRTAGGMYIIDMGITLKGHNTEHRPIKTPDKGECRHTIALQRKQNKNWLQQKYSAALGPSTAYVGCGRGGGLKLFHISKSLKYITKTCLFKYTENFTTKKLKIFRYKNSDIFHISAQNIDCGYSLEPPR